MHVPIRVRQLPQFVKQMGERSLVLRRPAAREPMFHLCYFTCHSYFAYLYCALHSLTLALKDVRYTVLVFSDNDMPLSDSQIATLKELVPAVRVIPWPKSMGWGAEQIGWIWKAYAMAADGAHEDDVIARVDSDVFFFNDRIFRAVARSDADFVGDGHFVDFEYCQGGAYFFRVRAVRAVLGLLAREDLPQMLDAAGINVEDVAAQHFAHRLGLRTWMTYFMMFPDELRNAGALTAWQRWKFSCLHFVMKNKKAMIDSYLQEILPASQRAGFSTAAATS